MLIDRALVEEMERLSVDFGVSIAAAVAAAEPDSGAEAWPLAGGCVVYTGLGMFVNGAKALGVFEPVADADLDRLEAYFVARGMATEIELCPWAEPGLIGRLAARGYALTSTRTYYARYLDVTDRVETPPLDPATTVEEASEETLPLLLRLRRDGFESVDGLAEISDRFTTAGARQAGAIDFIARLDGEPAGSAMLYVADGRALLGGMSTLPSFRGRGLQGALIRHRIARASELGCRLAVSTTVPANRSGLNLQRHGFGVAYTMANVQREVLAD
jgi:GNAT superfamily N-acetyltransferase